MTSSEHEQSKKGFFTKEFIQEAVKTVVATIAGAVVSGCITYAATERAIVESLSLRFEYIDQTMSAAEAIDALAKENEEQKHELDKKADEHAHAIDEKDDELTAKDQKINELKSEMKDMLSGSIESPSLIVEGLEQDSTPGRSLALIDGSCFYSESLVNKLLEGNISYSGDDKTIYYTAEPSGQASSKVYLRDTNVLYDGNAYEVFGTNNSNELAIGSEKYSYGFTIESSYWSDYAGYALFELRGRYSTLSFDVGRVNNTDLHNAMLKVFLNDEREPSQQYDLSPDVGSRHLEIQLDYAQSLKLQLSSDRGDAKYGFVNLVLSE